MNAPWHNLTGLSKVIAILATIAGIAFGLCSANLAVAFYVGSDNFVGRIFSSLPAFEGAIVILCVIGMLLVGVAGIIRAIVRTISNNTEGKD